MEQRREESKGEEFEEAEVLLYGPGIADQQIICVSNQKLIFSPIENFKVRFLRFLFSRFF